MTGATAGGAQGTCYLHTATARRNLVSPSHKDDTPHKRPADRDPAPTGEAGKTDACDESSETPAEAERDDDVPPRPVSHPIGEGAGNLARRGEWFRRRGGAS
jgi:hypothetical protein